MWTSIQMGIFIIQFISIICNRTKLLNVMVRRRRTGNTHFSPAAGLLYALTVELTNILRKVCTKAMPITLLQRSVIHCPPSATEDVQPNAFQWESTHHQLHTETTIWKRTKNHHMDVPTFNNNMQIFNSWRILFQVSINSYSTSSYSVL